MAKIVIIDSGIKRLHPKLKNIFLIIAMPR